MSLLAKALEVRVKASTKSTVTQDEVELAVAWFKGQVTSKQVAVALGGDEAKALGMVAWAAATLQTALREKQADLIAIAQGDLDEIDDSKEPPAPVLATGRKAVR